MNNFRRNFFITLGVSVAILLFLLGAFFYIFSGTIVPLSSEFRIAQENIKIAEGRSKDFKALVSKALERQVADIPKIEKLFFAYSPNSTAFRESLEVSARRHRLEYDIGDTPSGASLATTIRLTGAFSDGMSFLREIENGPILLDIESVSFRGTSKSIELNIKMLAQAKPQGSQ